MSLAAAKPDPAPAVVLAHAPPFRLGAMEVRPGVREVAGPGGREVLEPKVMQVLVALARAEGAILSRDDLIAQCWDGRAISEDAITRVISRLRRLSEGLGQHSWSVETITKVGYRLLTAGADDPIAAPLPDPGAPARPDRRLWLAGGAAAAAIAAAGGGALWWRSGRRTAGSPKARELVARARDAITQGDPEDSARAIGFLRAAVEDSPDYAAAWGALAMAYGASLTFTEPARQPGVMAQAHAAAKRALELDPRDPDALAAASFEKTGPSDLVAEEKQFERSVRAGVKDPRLFNGYSRLLMNVGRSKAATTFAERAAAGDPLNPWCRFGLGLTLWSAGRLEEAERGLREAMDLWPQHHAIWFALFYLLAYSGRPQEALDLASDPVHRPGSIPADDLELSLMGARALASRAPKDVETALAANLAAARRGSGYAENAFQWASALGHLDEAFAVARARYFGEGFVTPSQRFSAQQGRYSVGASRMTHQIFLPSTAAMRADPRFGKLVRDLGLVDYWKRSGHPPDDRAWAWGQLG